MSSRFTLFICAAAIFANQTAFAAQPAQKIFPYAYAQDDLPNGLRLVTVPTDYPNIVALYIVVQAGSRNEIESGHTGFAHLFEHLMFKGTERYSQQQYNDVIKRMGAESNAFTTDDYTCYQTVFSKEDLPATLAMEADRFQNLKFSEGEFKTETLAVLGEYNKNSSSPFVKLNEALRDEAYTTHTYKHVTMGFLKDVQDMPNQYDYSLKFFDRYYRPEYTTIILAGDVKQRQARDLVLKSWGAWKRGAYKAEIPAEPPQEAPRSREVAWPGPTLPLIGIAFKAPAYTDSAKDTAALDALSYLAFSENSELYQKLIIREQKADALFASAPEQVDAGLFQVLARVKKQEDVDYVRDQILSAIRNLQEHPVDEKRLDTVRQHIRYQLALSMDNSETIAQIVARFVALRRTPDTMNRLFDQYVALTPKDVQEAAAKYLTENARTIVRLQHAEASK
jgi:zinc protease